MFSTKILQYENKRVIGVRAQIRRAYGSPGGGGAMQRSEIGV